MSQQLALTAIVGTSSFSAVSLSAANWRSSSVVGASTNKPSTHKHFAFAASYAAYAKRGSWSPIG